MLSPVVWVVLWLSEARQHPLVLRLTRAIDGCAKFSLSRWATVRRSQSPANGLSELDGGRPQAPEEREEGDRLISE